MNPKKRPLPTTPPPLHVSEFLSEKAMMVDACLLEDALRSSLSSSRASSSLTDVQSRLKLSKIRDQIELLYSPSHSSTLSPTSASASSLLPGLLEEEDLLRDISTMCSVISSTSYPRSDWSKELVVQSVMTVYSQGRRTNQLFSPCGMTYSPDSKLFYVCDSDNHRIQMFRNHTQAELERRLEIQYLPPLGSAGSSSTTSLFQPIDICYHDGQLFIVDQGNYRVQVWRAEDGSFLRMIGTGSSGQGVGQFNNPCGCTIYENHLFVSDSDNHRIQKFSLSDFSVVKVIGSYGNRLGQFDNPMGLSVFNGKLYVADYYNHRISVFDPESGAALSVIGPSRINLSYPCSLLFSHNLLFVSNQHRISVFDSDHNYLYSFGSLQSDSGEGQLPSPQGMVMVNEMLFVCDRINGRVHVIEQKID